MVPGYYIFFAFQTPVGVIEPHQNCGVLRGHVTTETIGAMGPMTTAAGPTAINRRPTSSCTVPRRLFNFNHPADVLCPWQWVQSPSTRSPIMWRVGCQTLLAHSLIPNSGLSAFRTRPPLLRLRVLQWEEGVDFGGQRGQTAHRLNRGVQWRTTVTAPRQVQMLHCWRFCQRYCCLRPIGDASNLLPCFRAPPPYLRSPVFSPPSVPVSLNTVPFPYSCASSSFGHHRSHHHRQSVAIENLSDSVTRRGLIIHVKFAIDIVHMVNLMYKVKTNIKKIKILKSPEKAKNCKQHRQYARETFKLSLSAVCAPSQRLEAKRWRARVRQCDNDTGSSTNGC